MPILEYSNLATSLVSRGFQAMRRIERGTTGAQDPGIQGLSRVRRFLFLEYEPAVGSNIHATPMFEALKRAVPDAVTMVAGGRMAFEVFRHNPYIDYLVETPRPASGLLRSIRSLRAHLKATGFVPEIVITSKSSRQRSIALMGFLAAAAIRLGYTFAPELYDFPLSNDSHRSLIDNNLRIIERLGYQKDSVEPRVFYTRDDLEKTETLLRENGVAKSTARIVCVTQTSRTQRRGWPIAQFTSVLNHARSKYNADLIFAGTSSEAEEIDSLRAQIPCPSVSLAGQTTIQGMAALLASSDLVLTLDTGNMHMGRSVGVPMVILAPAWAPSIEWLPMGFDQFDVLLGDRDPRSPPDCEIIQIDAARLIEALDHMLTTYPPSDAARRYRAERNVSSIQR
jgi:ADP-heptose:LPS heptosyltransferase